MTEKDPRLNLMKIIKEDGISDLPMAVKGKFAQAIREERIKGHTTPLAKSLFNEALSALPE